jgi:hypothetical protein
MQNVSVGLTSQPSQAKPLHLGQSRLPTFHVIIVRPKTASLLTRMAWNRGNSFSLTIMAWNVGSLLLPKCNGLKWRKSALLGLEWRKLV